MASIPMEHGLLLASVLFALGMIGILVRRNLIFILMSIEIMLNAKTQRPSVCNALETLLVDQEIADEFVPKALDALAGAGVTVHGDERVRALFPAAVHPAAVTVASATG